MTEIQAELYWKEVLNERITFEDRDKEIDRLKTDFGELLDPKGYKLIYVDGTEEFIPFEVQQVIVQKRSEMITKQAKVLQRKRRIKPEIWHKILRKAA